MYWILFVMGAIAALAIALIVGGLATARSHVVSRELSLHAPIATVWAVVRDVGHYAEWRPSLDSSELLGDMGRMSCWCEDSPSGSITFGIVEDVAPTRFSARMLDEDVSLRGEWRWELTDAEGTTRIRLTQRGEIGNPVARFVAAHLTGHTRGIEQYLRDLAVRFGQSEAHVVDSARR